MITFKLIRQLEIDEAYQGITLSEFYYSSDNNFSNQQLIDSFIHSKSFVYDSLRENVKSYTGNIPFPKRAFEFSLINFDDFKELTKEGIIKFLNAFSNETDWEDVDGDGFTIIKNKFLNLLDNIDTIPFYILSKKCFEKKNKRLREFESDIYIYYFLILWIEKTKRVLTISEWTYE